jgi:hypothetical protein
MLSEDAMLHSAPGLASVKLLPQQKPSVANN